MAAPVAFAAGVVAGRLLNAEPLKVARMAGSSIAAPDAAGWVTDFLNAAYYRRAPDQRDIDDLRLAFCILTTRWHRLGRRLRAADVIAFHRAFGRDRIQDSPTSPRGTLRRDQLLMGAARLLGGWFPACYADDRHRGWGIAFETLGERRVYDPQARLRCARVGTLTPECGPPAKRQWSTYPPVEVPSVNGTIGAFRHVEAWPDYGTEVGRLTPLRPGGLPGQTFEVEVGAGAASGRPVFVRGYVTVTRVLPRDDHEGLRHYVQELNGGLAAHGDDPPAVPEGAEPAFAFDLTTHEGHFMGCGHSSLVLFDHGGRGYLRAVGSWDAMPWHLAQAYELAGREAQHAFWGGGDEAQSMLHQLARSLG
jgi:hypothetical protein